MKILVDILHPAHIHFFKHFIWEMKKKGHTFIITSRDKDCTIELLDKYKIPHVCLSKISKGKVSLGLELLKRMWKLRKICKREKPDLLMGVMGAVIAPVGKWLRIPSYVFYDTEVAWMTNRYVYHMCTKFITPECYEDKVPQKKHVTYKGYHELAYLHPDRFKPVKEIIESKGLELKKYIVLRLVSWQASHDIGDSGIHDIPLLIKELEKHGRVIITSENPLPEKYKKYEVPCSITAIHHVLAFAKLVVGESHTMASEAAVLGTPAITISKSKRGYTNDQERYGMVFNCSNQQDIMNILDNCINFNDVYENHKKMMEQKIDVTKWMIGRLT